MNTGHSSLNSLWADLIVDELVRTGIDYFCLSPGSRSTPLMAAVAQHSGVRHIMHFDERGAAFHALGYARATGRAAVVISTSGTAAANYFPAVVEASMDRVPLLLFTADRPPELRDTGANQSIDQVQLYGKFTRWFFDTPCPSADIEPQVVLTTIDQAVYRTTSEPPGPVHVNCMFREPLAPTFQEEDFSNYLAPLCSWQAGSKPYTQYNQTTAVVEPSRLEQAAGLIREARKGAVVAGRLRSDRDREAILKVAGILSWPVIADIGSGLRLGCADSNVIPYADHLIGNESFAEKRAPDTVIHFGSPITSKRVNRWLSGCRPLNYIQVDNHPYRTDPEHQVTHRYESDIGFFCDFLLPFLNETKSDAETLAHWREASTAAGKAVDGTLRDQNGLSEPSTARIVSRLIRRDSCLFLASSMAIRDMDMFAVPDGPPVPVGCNRGASGIDGTVATFTGFCHGHACGGTLLIGDLALLHDLNSLALAAQSEQPLVIVVLNNNGGGIFHFLPITERTDLFEQFWGTPHGCGFADIAEMFGLSYTSPGNPSEFESTFRQAQQAPRASLIEVVTDRKANLTLHQEILKAVTQTRQG